MESKLYHGDCCDILPTLEDNSIDLTVTSPPYDNLRTYEGSLVWDRQTWEFIIYNLYRITKQGGVVVWVVGDATIKGSETGTSFRQALWAMKCGFNLHDTMIWTKKGGGAIGSNLTYTQNFEYMMVFSKGQVKTFNPIKDIKNESFGKDRSGTGRRKKDGQIKREQRHPNSEYSKRNNWWYIPVTHKSDHPASFPFSLAEDHIKSWSNPGDTILDPFLGSGTTGQAALQLERNFIGIEKVNKYYDIAEDRIKNHIQRKLFV